MTNRHTIDNDLLLGEICDRLSEGKSVRLRAKGQSMHPFIRNGVDLIVLSPIEILKNGDIVLARIDNTHYVLHRVINIDDDNITLMGDANLYAQEKCQRKDIFGKATCLIRNGQPISLSSSKALRMAKLWTLLLPFRRLVAPALRRISR